MGLDTWRRRRVALTADGAQLHMLLAQIFALLVPPPPVGAGRCPRTTLSCGGSPAPSAGCSFALPEFVVVGGTLPPQH